MSKKQKFKKFLKYNWKVIVWFFVMLTVCISMLCCFKGNKVNVNVLGSETSQVEKKSRIVNDNEIWSDNLFNYSTFYNKSDNIQVSDSNIRFNNSNSNRRLYISRYNQSGQSIGDIMSTSTDLNYTYSLYVSSTESNYYFRIQLYDGSSWSGINYLYLNAFNLSAINTISCEVRFNTNNVDLNFIMINEGEKIFPFAPYGQIGYTKEYYDYQMEQTPLNIIQQNMTIVNDKFRWTFPTIYNNTYANFTVLDKSLKVFVYDPDLTKNNNMVYNGVTYPTSYKIRGRYDCSVSINESYINFDLDSGYMNGLIGFELNCYLPQANKELLLFVYFNNSSPDDAFNEIESEEREVITYTTNSIKSIAFSELMSQSLYKEKLVLVNYIEFYKSTVNDQLTNNNRVIAYESNLTANDNYNYYLDGYRSGVNAVQTSPNGYGLYTETQYNNYGELKYNEGLESDYNMSDDIITIAETPINILKEFLNFNILGVNMWALLSGIVTLALGLWLIRKVV